MVGSLCKEGENSGRLGGWEWKLEGKPYEGGLGWEAGYRRWEVKRGIGGWVGW
jgi:hypothetical protein